MSVAILTMAPAHATDRSASVSVGYPGALATVWPSAIVDSVTSPITIQAHLDGICTSGEFCMAAAVNFGNQSLADFATDDSSLFNNKFLSPGLNQGLTVANNSVWGFNHDTTRTVVICTGTNFTGQCGSIFPSSGGTYAVAFRNNVESLFWT